MSQQTTTDYPRLVTPCRCKQQDEHSWGYALWKWVGSPKSWEAVGGATHLEDVVEYIAKKELPKILIKCNGCGSEMLREYPK